MPTLFNYIPEEVTVLLAGIYSVEGYVDGTFVSVSKDVTPFTSKRTPDGTIARVYNNDRTYTIDITVHNGSKANDFMTLLWRADEISNGRGKFPVLIKDHSGTDLFFCTTAWIEQIPSVVKSNGIDARTWTIRASGGTINVGNNTEVAGVVDDLINLAIGSLPALEGLL